MPTRRRLLRSSAFLAGVTSSGCISRLKSDNNLVTIESATIEEYETEADAPLERYEIDSEWSPPSAYDLSISTNVLRETGTLDEPAQVEVSVENLAADARKIRTRGGEIVPHTQGGVVSMSEMSPLLYIVSPEEDVEQKEEDCLQLGRIGFGTVPSEEVTFAPEETVRKRFDLWGTVENDECFPSEIYMFPQLWDRTNDRGEDIFSHWGIIIEVS